MHLPDEIVLQIMQYVPYSETNETNISLVNKRFYNLMGDKVLARDTAQLQFHPYTLVFAEKWSSCPHLYELSRPILSSVYDTYKSDRSSIQLIQTMTGHSAKVCMNLVVLLKLIKSEMPIVGKRGEVGMALDRQRATIFKLLMVQNWLPPDVLVLLRYTVEFIRHIMGRNPKPLRQHGWLTTNPPREFSYFTFFEEGILRNCNVTVWSKCLFDMEDLRQYLDSTDVTALMFERQAEFMATGQNDEDDVLWAATMGTHHAWGRALWSDLTEGEKRMVSQQARLIPDDVEFASPEFRRLSRVDRANRVHTLLMEHTRKKVTIDFAEKVIDSLDLVKIKEKLSKGRVKVEAMDEDHCMQALVREVEQPDLLTWVNGVASPV